MGAGQTDPARQKTVLYVTAEVVRQIAILTQPVMPDASSKLLDSLGIPRRKAGAQLCGAGHADQGRHAVAATGGRISALRRTKGRLTSMPAHARRQPLPSRLPDFAEDLDAIVARAETAGIGRIVTISTRVKRLGGLLAISPSSFPTSIARSRTHCASSR